MKTIQATVLRKNNSQFVCNPCGSYGVDMPIPAENAYPVANYWARPIKADYFQGFEFVVNTGQAAPTVDSIEAFMLTDRITNDSYMVCGTIADYTAAANACCDASPIPDLTVTLATIAPCQTTCTQDGTDWFVMFAVETLTSGKKYVAEVVVDNVVVASQDFATGSTNIANLVTWLNANATSAGTWSNPDENAIKLVTDEEKEVCFFACIKTS